MLRFGLSHVEKFAPGYFSGGEKENITTAGFFKWTDGGVLQMKPTFLATLTMTFLRVTQSEKHTLIALRVVGE